MILSAHASRPGQEDFNHSSIGNKTKVLKTEVAETSAAGALIHQRHRSEQRIREHFFDAEHTQPDAAELYKELDLKGTWESLSNDSLKAEKNISDNTTRLRKKDESFQKYLAQEKIREAYLGAQNAADEISLNHFRVSLENRKFQVAEHQKEIDLKMRVWEQVKKSQDWIIQARRNLMDVINRQRKEILYRATQEERYRTLEKQKQIKQQEEKAGTHPHNSKVSLTMEELDAEIAKNSAKQSRSKARYLELDDVRTKEQERINREVERLKTVGENHDIPHILNRSTEAIEDEIEQTTPSVLKSLEDPITGGGKSTKKVPQRPASLESEETGGGLQAAGLRATTIGEVLPTTVDKSPFDHYG